MDKLLKYAVIGLSALMGVLLVVYFSSAGGVSSRVHEKSARVMAGANVVMQQGGDVSEVLGLIGQIKPLLAQGDVANAEAVLDKALILLGPAAAVDLASIKPVQLPLYEQIEEQAALFGAPQPVRISGYEGSAMDPFLSPDGQFLIFSDEAGPLSDGNLFYARKTDTSGLLFEFIGPVPGTITAEMEAGASIDEHGRLFFTSLRDYSKTLNALYTGRFTAEGAADVRPLFGLSSSKPGWIMTDAQASADGKILYFTQSQFLFGQQVPLQSDLLAAVFADGRYEVDSQSASIMAAINTPALEYAPSITPSGLEIYFARASRERDAAGNEVDKFRIMAASRPDLGQPFGTAYAISSIKGHVGGPHITPEGGLYYHAREGGKFGIYRAGRAN